MNTTIAQIIFLQLKNTLAADGFSGRTAMFCWRATDFVALDRGLVFSVDGLKFQGKVCIELNALDLYDVHFTPSLANVGGTKTFTDIYFDCLVDLIDSIVEK